SLPGVKQQYMSPDSGQIEAPIPSVDQILTVVGTVEISSEAIASAVKSWLTAHPTKITLSNSRGLRGIDFVGPGLDKSVEEIETVIDELVREENSNQIRIRALQLSDPGD